MSATSDLLNITIKALQEKKAKLQDELNQIETAIKKFKRGDLSGLNGKSTNEPPKDITLKLSDSIRLSDNLNANVAGSSSATGVLAPSKESIRLIIISILDNMRQPLKMSELQSHYTNQTNSEYNIREIVRGLNNQKYVKLMKINKSNKNAYWVKTEWINKETKALKDEYKFPGFDTLYSPYDIEFF